MPILPVEEIKKLAVGGSLRGFSIDTSVYEQYKFGFEVGVLAQLKQFSRIDTEHLITDLVLHEIRFHLVREADLAFAHLKNSLKPLGNFWGISKELRDNLLDQLSEKTTGRERTEARLVKFLRTTFATTVKSADYASLERALQRFFSIEAPFGNSEAKKNEFPDAFSLLALEGWASENETKVLVVSQDDDWRRFCEESTHLVFMDDLPRALSVFHGGADEAAAILRESLRFGKAVVAEDFLNGALGAQTEKVNVSLEANSNWYYEPELLEIGLSLTGDINEEFSRFEVIDFSNGQLRVRCRISVEMVAKFSVTFDHWDGIDREYIPFGSTTVEQAEEELIELIASFSFANGVAVLDDVELLEGDFVIDFGEIEPDWMDEREES